MIETFPDFRPPVEELFRLANTPFEPETFRSVCESFATLDPTSSDDDLWNFDLDSNAKLIVSVAVERTGTKPNGWPQYRQVAVGCAILSICWWETFLRSAHETDDSFNAERSEFDRLYDEALGRTTAALGGPLLEGTDRDARRYRHAIWRGKTGLLILQQSAYDPQFGHDINYWIQPWSGPDPSPTSPFIVWLCKLGSPAR
jgi:hypothetical protein